MGQAPTHGGTGRSRTTDFRGLVTGAGNSYNSRSGQPRQQQRQPLRGQGRLLGQAEVVRAGDDVDGHGVDISSGSDAEDLDSTLEDDDPVNTDQGLHSLVDDAVMPERRQSNLAGDLKVTEVQLRSLNGSSNATPELRQTSLAGGLLTTEERRRYCAAAAGDYENVDGVTPRSSCLSSDANRSDVDIGVKPHSSCLSYDVNCSDSVDYSRIQRVMDLVRHHREDDDDVTLPSWRQLVQHNDGGCTSNSPSVGPDYPTEMHNNRLSGNVCSQGRPVKHTRFWYDGDYYAGDLIDDIFTADEYEECRVERAQERGECRESRVQVNSGQKVNTTEFTSIHNSCDDGVMYERYQSSAFIQLTLRHESHISDGLNTHEVSEYRNDMRDEEVSISNEMNGARIVEMEPTQ